MPESDAANITPLYPSKPVGPAEMSVRGDTTAGGTDVMPPLAYAQRCQAPVWHRDTYRRTGRGPTGFEMHYIEKRCQRKATHDGYCWQHRPLRLPAFGSWLRGHITEEEA